VPQYSEINSRTQCDVRSRFSKNVPLKIPIVSSPMDTVTEDQMAREMAMQGGLGIIHRFCTIKEQASMVKKVKSAMAWIVKKPHLINEDTSFKELKEILRENHYKTFIVVK
jgi:IMP dehydrogenase